MKKKNPRYVNPGKEYGDASYGDPWVRRGQEPDAVSVFDTTWRVVTEPEEGVIGRAFTFFDGVMNLVTETTRQVIGAQNTRTGVVQWIPVIRGRFGTDQLPQHRMQRYKSDGLQISDTTLAKMLGGKAARRIHVDVDAQIRARGGHPEHRSQFKHPHRPTRVK